MSIVCRKMTISEKKNVALIGGSQNATFSSNQKRYRYARRSDSIVTIFTTVTSTSVAFFRSSREG